MGGYCTSSNKTIFMGVVKLLKVMVISTFAVGNFTWEQSIIAPTPLSHGTQVHGPCGSTLILHDASAKLVILKTLNGLNAADAPTLRGTSLVIVILGTTVAIFGSALINVIVSLKEAKNPCLTRSSISLTLVRLISVDPEMTLAYLRANRFVANWRFWMGIGISFKSIPGGNTASKSGGIIPCITPLNASILTSQEYLKLAQNRTRIRALHRQFVRYGFTSAGIRKGNFYFWFGTVRKMRESRPVVSNCCDYYGESI
jgi:hypothetical protein